MPLFENQPARNSLPLLRMGQDIHRFYLCRYPSFRTEKPTCELEKDPDFIRRRISKRYVGAKDFLFSDNAPACLHPFRHPVNKRQKPERIYALALSAFYSFSTIFADRTIDGLTRAVSVCSSTDTLDGSLAATVALHELLETQLLFEKDNEIYMNPDLLDYISENNPMVSSPIKMLTKKERNDAATALQNLINSGYRKTPDQYFGKLSLMPPEKIEELKRRGMLDGFGDEASSTVIFPPIAMYILKT